MKEQELQPPPGWGDDSLGRVLLSFRRNWFSVFVHGKDRYNGLREISRVFEGVGRGEPANQAEIVQAVFIGRAMSAFIGAAGMALSGQVVDLYTMSRSTLEWATYSSQLLADQELLRKWWDRHEDERSRGAARNAVNFKKCLGSVEDSLLRDRISTLYEECIDKGAHPNPAAAFDALKFEPRPGRGDTAMTVLTQSRNPRDIDVGLDFVGRVGLAALQVMSVSCRPMFQRAGVRSPELASLERRLRDARPYEVGTFGDSLPENSAAAARTQRKTLEILRQGLNEDR